MDFKNYDTISDTIKNQIQNVTDVWINHLGNALSGVYIHGSMALKCFAENQSDIDFLIVSNRP